MRELGIRQTKIGHLEFDLQFYCKTEIDRRGSIPVWIDSSELLKSFGDILVDNIYIKKFIVVHAKIDTMKGFF